MMRNLQPKYMFFFLFFFFLGGGLGNVFGDLRPKVNIFGTNITLAILGTWDGVLGILHKKFID